jgi:hypothetical protein
MYAEQFLNEKSQDEIISNNNNTYYSRDLGMTRQSHNKILEWKDNVDDDDNDIISGWK